jgi:plastocyanin
MQKALSLLALLALGASFLVPACGNSDSDDSTPASTCTKAPQCVSGAIVNQCVPELGDIAAFTDCGNSLCALSGAVCPGGGGAGAAGTGGAGGSAQGGAGGAAGGAGGSDAGAAGQAGQAAFTYQSFAGCTFEKAVAATTTTVTGTSYTTPCLKVKAGDVVSLPGSSGHPLKGMVDNGDQPNPITVGQPASGYTSAAMITFTDKGSFGFYCQFHGSDTDTAGSMTGVVYVE